MIPNTAAMLNSKPVYVVIYRIGGTLNFAWHKTTSFDVFEDAERCREGIKRGGRPAYIALSREDVPTTYEGTEAFRK